LARSKTRNRKVRKSNVEFKKRYNQVSFLIDRGDDEEEFLAVIEMEDINKPKMKKNN
jgi:hypothetical protein